MGKENKRKHNLGIFFAILAAVLYALNAPFSKCLLAKVQPTLMAGLLYLGAGLGMAVIFIVRKLLKKPTSEKKLTKNDLPYTIAMILLDIAAPICLLVGLKYTSAANASLLNNFEIVATAIIALIIFKEAVSPKLWAGILFITISCVLLSYSDISAFSLNFGSLFVLLACVFWGFENNCTRKLSAKDPLQIVLLKGIFSGTGSVIIGLILGERVSSLLVISAVLILGLFAYGLSIYFYVHAQRILGAARTSAYYAVAPFVGTGLSLLIFRETPSPTYFIALIFMIIGAVLSA